LYLLERPNLKVILLPDEDGTPTIVEPQPFVTRAAYLARARIEREDIAAAEMEITAARMLLVMLPCPDGPPGRAAMCFTLQGPIHTPWKDKTIHHGDELSAYDVTTTQGAWSWLSDYRVGKPGYFLTGIKGDGGLWRIFRIEADPFTRALLTLMPVQLTTALPNADFSVLTDPLVRAEVTAQYRDLARAIAHYAFRDVVTKARNIVEAIVASKLNLLDSADDRLATALKKIRELLDNPQTRDTCGWNFLAYHSAQKIRLLHGRTHAVARAPLVPEHALSVVADLVFLLSEWGCVRQV
jgi:hypothetical protein